jgi:hypothetical protein
MMLKGENSNQVIKNVKENSSDTENTSKGVVIELSLIVPKW